VARRQDHLALGPVAEAGQFLAGRQPLPAALRQLGRLHQGDGDLLAADRLHFLAHRPLDGPQRP
jgi:hypothetical protein